MRWEYQYKQVISLSPRKLSLTVSHWLELQASINAYMLGRNIQQITCWNSFLFFFPEKSALTYHANCRRKLSHCKTIHMKCQTLFFLWNTWMLTCSTLRKTFSRKYEIFFFFFRTFRWTGFVISCKLHEIRKPVFWGKYHQLVIWIYRECGKG